MNTRRKTLTIVTIIEIISLIITIFTIATTFEFIFTVILTGLMRPWLGNTTGYFMEHYNVPLIMAESMIGLIALNVFVITNIIRFIMITKRQRIAFGIGIILLIVGYRIYLSVVSNLLFALFFIPSVVLIIYSHLPNHIKE